MAAPKGEIMADLKYCKELLDRIIKYSEKHFTGGEYFCNHHTVVQADIVKLRRELNEINHKLRWDWRENDGK